MAKMRTKEIIPEKTPQKRGTDSYSYEKACNAAKNSGTPTYRFAVGDRVQVGQLPNCVVEEVMDDGAMYTLEELVRKDSGNRPSFLYNDNFISFWEIVWNLSEDTDESCLPYVESITATGGIFTDENGNKDVFMGCINGCSATLTQCEYTCGRYCTCDAVAVANDLLRDNELKS